MELETKEVPKYLKKRSDGYVYPYTPTLAERPDMIPYDGEVEPPEFTQDHPTVRQKWEAGLPLTQAEMAAYPKYMNPKKNVIPPAESNDEVVRVKRKYVRKENPTDAIGKENPTAASGEVNE
jgi:hypothetical protein